MAQLASHVCWVHASHQAHRRVCVTGVVGPAVANAQRLDCWLPVPFPRVLLIRPWLAGAGVVEDAAGFLQVGPCFLALDADQRRDIRLPQGRPAADALHAWLLAQRERIPEGSATARAINYSLGRWEALTRYLDDGHLPIDNNWVENQIRPIAIGRNNWRFAGSLRAGQRAAAIMSPLGTA